jgi:hypothetical protein
MLHVAGEYHYINSWPIPVAQGISCPVGLSEGDILYSLVLWTVDKETGERRYIPMMPTSKGGSLITLRFGGGEELVLFVDYTIKLAGNRGKYLLRTTRSWDEPIRKADFYLDAGSSRLSGSNYELDIIKDGVYSFSRENFYPENDWEFSWEK